MLIVSPCFVPGKGGTAALVAAERRGARVRIFTNSLAANDVTAVHAGYKKSPCRAHRGLACTPRCSSSINKGHSSGP